MVPRHELARHIERCEDKPSLTTEDGKILDGNDALKTIHVLVNKSVGGG